MLIRWMIPGAAGAACALVLTLPLPGSAQDGYEQPVHTTAAETAARWLEGRYRMPVTCIRNDDSQVEIEEAVVFRLDPSNGRSAIKATYFGIDGDFKRCFNIVEGSIPDRRGTLYLHFPAHNRPDTGLSEFRRMARDGDLTFRVHGGKLRLREIGKTAETARTLDFDHGEYPLNVRAVDGGSDAAKLLADFDDVKDGLTRQRRRLSFTLSGPEEFQSVAHMIEDEGRWR